MKKLFKGINIIAIVVLMLIMLLQIPVNATNYNLEIVKTDNEYLLYISTIMQNEFQFAFTNSNTTDKSTLNFINSIKDEQGNNVAYVDKELEETYFKDKNGENINQYMWIKQDNQINNPIEIDLSTAITQEVIDFVNKTTTRIPITIGQEEKKSTTEGNKKITTTVGYLKIDEQKGDTYEYQLVKLPNTEYTRFVELAKEISMFENNANSYENIVKINEFYELYNNLLPTKWEKVTDGKIEQPADAEDGEEYVVWIKSKSPEGKEIADVQFMTSVREEKEKTSTQTVTEEVSTKTKLPVTFDSNIILIIAFVIIVLAIIILLVLRKKITKKN